MQPIWFVRLEDYARPFMAFATYADAEAFAKTYEDSRPLNEKGVEIYEGWLVLND